MVMENVSHEGMVVTDGRNQFLIKNGRRVWLSTPPPALRQELLIEADRLAASQSIRSEFPTLFQ
jgi:hypothetical protein